MSLIGSLPILGVFVSTVIISPISEELIFRGVFLNRLKLFIPTLFAVLISSLLFAALHSFGSIISAFVFAVCMALLYLKTENICVPILAHFLNNLFAELIRIADYNNLLFTNGVVMSVVSILAIISAIILLKSITKELNNLK
jgi:membrane protease YdiL (CAAX protease family)